MRLLEYLAGVRIDSRPAVKLFWSVAEPWQREIARAMSGALESAAALTDSYDGPRSFWLTRTRGSDKTSAIARFCTWLLLYARRPVTAVVAASTREQASELKTAIVRERALNPWIGDSLRIVRSEVRGPGGTLQIVSADAAAQYGRRPDLIICDELTNWGQRELWDALLSAQPKRDAVLVVMCNAGFQGTWQWTAFQAAQRSSRWWVHNPTGRDSVAGWISPEQVAEQERLLPPAVFQRLWMNQWVAERGDYLTWAEIVACRDERLAYRHEGVRGVRYTGAVDYGEKHDRTVGVILHAERDGKIVVDAMDVWTPTPGAPVQIGTVEEWIHNVTKRFNRPLIVADPWHLGGIAQRLRGACRVENWNATGTKQQELAYNLRSLVVNRLVSWYPGCGDSGGEDLERELAELIVRQTERGWRFDHKAGCHDDRAVTLGMAALECQARPVTSMTPDVIVV